MGNREKVLKALQDSGEWMYIIQVAKATGLNRVTTSTHLWVLEGKGLIENKKLGTAQLFRYKGV